jgi:hypothetical protein
MTLLPDAAGLERLEVAGHVGRARAAVAGDDGRHALHEVAEVRPRRRHGQGVIAVCVQVNEARGDGQPAAVDDARPAGDGESADGDDAFAAKGDIALGAGLAAAVVEGGAADDEFGPDGGLSARDKRGGK